MKFTTICQFSDDHSDIELRRTLEEFVRQNQGVLDDPGRFQTVQVEPANQPGIPGGGFVKPDVTDARYILTRVCQDESVFGQACAVNVRDILGAVYSQLHRRAELSEYVVPSTSASLGNPDPGSMYWEHQVAICQWLIDLWQTQVLIRFDL